MDHTGVTPPVALHAPDIADLLLGEGPFLSVYLATEAAIDNAAQRSELRWKDLRRQLEGEGADEQALAAVDPLVADAHLEGECLVAIATPKGLAHVSHEPDPPTRDLGRWGVLPVVGPLLEWRQSQVRHIVALVDRRGADVFVFRPDGRDTQLDVEGGEDPLAKSKPGGWSQRRYQQRAQNTWEANAQDVAAELVNLVVRDEPRLLAIGGDVRAVELVKEALPDHVLDLVRDLDGSRSPDGSIDEAVDEVTRLVATAVAEDTTTILRKFREEKGEGDRAADGPTATIDALNRAQVEVLLVHADPDSLNTAFYGPEPVPIAERPDDLVGLGVEQPLQGPLVEVAIRAALGTGAGLRLIPGAGGPTDGMGAILRWQQ